MGKLGHLGYTITLLDPTAFKEDVLIWGSKQVISITSDEFLDNLDSVVNTFKEDPRTYKHWTETWNDDDYRGQEG